MKKVIFVFLMLMSFYSYSQEKITVNNETEIYDKDGKLFMFYGHGATLKLVKKYTDYAEVEINGTIYKVLSKYYEKKTVKKITIGMDSYEVVSILGQPNDTMKFETAESISTTFIYGKTYYHFKNDKLVAIDSY